MAIQINSIADLRILLREERMRQGIGQDQIPGLGRTTVLGFENGKGDARMETLFAIMQALGVRITIDFDQMPQSLDVDDDLDLGLSQAGSDDEIDPGIKP